MLDNVKNKYIIKVIFRNVKNKRKLNIIKYNKRILARLNINKNDFENYIVLKEYNDKYDTNIEDFDIEELNLNGKNIGNPGLKSLFKVDFKKLKTLDLSDNKISDINVLEKINFGELVALDLSNNSISNIKLLEKTI